MLDLDRFKEINERFGHRWGDEVLKRAAKVTQTVLRGTDLPGRYGDDEFAVMMPEILTEEAASVAERSEGKISRIELDTGNDRINIQVSIGVASLLPGELEHQSLINRADAALHSAKREGRNCVFCATNPRPAEKTGEAPSSRAGMSHRGETRQHESSTNASGNGNVRRYGEAAGRSGRLHRTSGSHGQSAAG